MIKFFTFYTLNNDLSHLKKKPSEDSLGLHISQILDRDLNCSGKTLNGYWTIQFVPYRDSKIIRIDVKKAPKHVFAKQPNVQAARQPPGDKNKLFRFVRMDTRAQPLSVDTWCDYIISHWRDVGANKEEYSNPE